MLVKKKDFQKVFLTLLKEQLTPEQMSEILSNISLSEDASPKLKQYIVGNVGFGEADVSVGINPQTMDPYELVNSLREKVVRLVFRKVNGEYRVMYATRNPEIIKLYDSNMKDPNKKVNGELSDLENADKVARQVESDSIRAFDLEKNEFRAFKPSRLMEYDYESEVPSWIEMNPEQDAWYVLAKEGSEIKDLYDSEYGVLYDKAHARTRTDYESQAWVDLRDAQYTREENAKVVERVNSDPEYQRKKREDRRDSYLKKLLEYMNVKLKNDQFGAGYHNFSQVGEQYLNDTSVQREMGYEVQSVANVGHNILIVQTDNQDVILFHPFVMVNTTTGHVYFQLVNLFPSVQQKEGYEVEEEYLKYLVSYANLHRKSIKRTIPTNYTEGDSRRVVRIKQLIEANKEEIFTAHGVKMEQLPMGNGFFTAINTANFSLQISPSYSMLKFTTNGNSKILEMARRESPTSVNPMVAETVKQLSIVAKRIQPNQASEVNAILEVLNQTVVQAYNLRRSI